MRGGLGFVLCALWVALVFASLWLGLSGLMVTEPAGGVLRVLGGFAGFFLLVGITIVAMNSTS
jgi:hypothetical protein